MSINKNDCLDCKNCVCEDKKSNWICLEGHEIIKDKNGIVEVLDHDCYDFEYEE
ncbi:hypothetical protein RSJ2_3961 (plasmid) [Clostridium botulinum]|uniref:hypothetical protein n=1 Tax=Clostridium botulinum TaxID=1491 RepID=UPI0002D3C44D|nr:hypothetical protein [Clostridium botulinum]APR02348.1 hypothetical protein RSJ2_3961 [Clostridium botulinum]MBD5589330.1 hypothetical protein [Clostridium botulinum]MBY6850372.1 hypothetical protein [Clostridium botulinum]MBY6857432.1 hypothetical protein [Clostridium botulinum]MBY6967402.1 hypothetical protein [Clostridium botulinum]